MTWYPETTHSVDNQPAARDDVNEYTANPPLVEVGGAFTPHADEHAVDEIGAHVGTAEFQQAAHLVNAEPPQLPAHDRWGHRIDHVEFHPAYHDIMRTSLGYGTHSLGWTKPGANAERAARFSLFAQIEPGHRSEERRVGKEIGARWWRVARRETAARV